MDRHRLLRPIIFAVAAAGLLAGCALLVGRPTTVPGPGRLDVPQPTATQIATGANPNPSIPQMNQFAVQLYPAARTSRCQSLRLDGERPLRPDETFDFRREPDDGPGAGGDPAARMDPKAARAIPGRQPRRRRRRYRGAAHLLWASDGTRLQMEIAHRRGVARDGNQPTLLTVDHPTTNPRRLCSSHSCWSGWRWGAYMRAPRCATASRRTSPYQGGPRRMTSRSRSVICSRPASR